jgi:hypothetical protein
MEDSPSAGDTFKLSAATTTDNDVSTDDTSTDGELTDNNDPCGIDDMSNSDGNFTSSEKSDNNSASSSCDTSDVKDTSHNAQGWSDTEGTFGNAEVNESHGTAESNDGFTIDEVFVSIDDFSSNADLNIQIQSSYFNDDAIDSAPNCSGTAAPSNLYSFLSDEAFKQ